MRGPFMNHVKVILVSVLAACTYGVLHDQVTVRLCIEYFTIAHPPLFSTESPTWLALSWGIAATAGVGVALGFLLALVSQSDKATPYPLARLVRSILLLLGVTALAALGAGLLGHVLSVRGVLSLPAALAQAIPVSRHDRFFAVWFAHGAGYLAGLVGGGVICFRVWRARGRPRVLEVLPRTRAGAVRVAVVALLAALVFAWRFGCL